MRGLNDNIERLTKAQILNRLNRLRKKTLINIANAVSNGLIYIEHPHTTHKLKKLKTITLEPQSQINVPEIYILSQEGTSLFHFDIMGDMKENPVNEDLVSSYLSALNMFTDTMGWEEGVNGIKSGQREVRFWKGEHVIVCIVSNIEDEKSRYQIIPILEDFAQELCNMFEQKYQQDLERGSSLVSKFSGFKNLLQTLLEEL